MADKKEIDGYQVHSHCGPHLPQNYLNFILSSWLKSYRNLNDYIKLINSDCYFLAYEKYLKNLLKRESTRIMVAVLADNFDTCLGYSVTNDAILYYIYVQKPFRRNGIGSALLPFEIDEFTHLTKIGLKIWPKKAPQAKFNPFL